MVLNDNDSSWTAVRIQEAISIIEGEHVRPSVLYRAKLTKHFTKWCAFIGQDPLGPTGAGNLKTEFFAFGDSPDEAMRTFDKLWYEKTTNEEG